MRLSFRRVQHAFMGLHSSESVDPNPSPSTSPTTDLDDLNEMLARSGSGYMATSAELVAGGLANVSYKATLAGMSVPVVVRFYVRDPTAARREASILDRVKRVIPVPEVVAVSPDVHHRPTHIVLRWVNGVPLDLAIASCAAMDAKRAVRETGEVLARLEAFSFKTPGFFGETMDVAIPWPSGRHEVVGLVERCLFNDVAGDRLGNDLTERAWRYVRENQDALRSIEKHSTLVHGDFNGFNVIVSRSGVPRVAALIDWEYAHAGTPLLDLASMLRRPGRNLPAWFEEELLAGYRMAGGVLPNDWKRAAQVVDVVRLCTFVRSPNVGEFAVDGVRALLESALGNVRHADGDR